MLDGISAAWFQKVTIERGAAAQTNFNKYPLLRMEHAPPTVAVHFIKSSAPPTGLGEPALPPAAPAVCNAIFAAMGLSVAFLLCYVAYHFTTEETRYGGTGGLRTAYFFLLISHIILAGLSLPAILFTFIAGWTNRFAAP
jgi:hypothetical protein